MKVPEQFIDFDKINTIKHGPDILYRLEDALHITGVMAGKTHNTCTYHRDKVLGTFNQLPRVKVPKRRKGEAGVLAHHYYDENVTPKPGVTYYAPPGTYVSRAMLYRLLFLSNLQANQRAVEAIELEVTPAIYDKGFFICDGLSTEQKKELQTLVSAL